MYRMDTQRENTFSFIIHCAEYQPSVGCIYCPMLIERLVMYMCKVIPESKVHGANMGSTWVLSAPDGSHVGPMNLAIRDTWSLFYVLIRVGNTKTNLYFRPLFATLICYSTRGLPVSLHITNAMYLPLGLCKGAFYYPVHEYVQNRIENVLKKCILFCSQKNWKWFSQKWYVLSETYLQHETLSRLSLTLLTLSWDKNWDSHSLVNGYPSFYPRIALVAPSPAQGFYKHDLWSVGSNTILLQNTSTGLTESVRCHITFVKTPSNFFVGKSPVSGEFPAQRPVTRSFDVFFDLRLNKRLNKQSWGCWF